MIDIDKLICTLIDDKRLDLGLRASLRDALKQQGIVYNLDGSMIKIGEPKKCDGQLGKMLKEMALDNSTEDKTHKFNVGDWITDNNDTDRIEKITDRGYHFASGDWGKIDDIEKYYHQWTIQDAKPGDVLVNQNGEMPFIFKACKINHVYCYCGYTNHKDIFFEKFVDNEGEELHWANLFHEQVYPATKEQRDLLFKKMHEAGYEWDGEALELRKISQRMESAKAKEDGYQKPDFTEFELKLKELFGITDFAAKDIGNTLMGIARKQIVEEIDEDIINEMVEDRAEYCGISCILYYEENVKNYRKGILDTLEQIKKR